MTGLSQAGPRDGTGYSGFANLQVGEVGCGSQWMQANVLGSDSLPSRAN